MTLIKKMKSGVSIKKFVTYMSKFTTQIYTCVNPKLNKKENVSFIVFLRSY